MDTTAVRPGPRAAPTAVARRRRLERLLAVGALLLIGAAWLLGSIRAEGDLMPAVRAALPAAETFERVAADLFEARAGGTLIGYVAVGTGTGYGGPLRLAVGVSPSGEVLGVSLVDHKETAGWLRRVMANNLWEALIGKTYADRFELGADVDAVTGATYTTRGMAEAVRDGSQEVARHVGMAVPERQAPKVTFGVPEIVLLALFAVGYVGHRRGFKYVRRVRWGSMLAGLVLLGFLYNAPLTLAHFVKLMLGYWPAWQTNLYWYFLIGGLLFVYTVDNKNPYCEWFCPFGAAQECMGAVGGAKVRAPGSFVVPLKWLQRGLALSAVLLGVYFRNPGLASFELFGTLFDLVGTGLQFAALALVLLAALYIKRPWCEYLCPLHAVVEMIGVLRGWAKEIWQRMTGRLRAV